MTTSISLITLVSMITLVRMIDGLNTHYVHFSKLDPISKNSTGDTDVLRLLQSLQPEKNSTVRISLVSGHPQNAESLNQEINSLNLFFKILRPIIESQ